MENAMLTFGDVDKNPKALEEFSSRLSRNDLHRLTNEMIDEILRLTSECQDADVVFEPSDPEAHDTYAATPEEVSMPWTLGHVIVHTTASSEESAALAAELARGVRYHGRSRYEVPWPGMRTIQECRARLEESRRMRLASLDMWPDEPHLENVSAFIPEWPKLNAVSRFLVGLMHDQEHLGQIADIVGHAGRAKGAT
jgi:hypothetical protein